MGQIEIAVSILSALLTGGFILFFIESQHIEQVVNDKFRSIMNPYYSKLSAFMVATYFIELRFKHPAKNTPSEKLIKEISKTGGLVHVSGRDIPYMDSKKLTVLNEKINNIWYYYDKGHYKSISFDTSENHVFQKEEVFERINKISTQYSKYKFDKYLLPNIAGLFYIDIWQKVEYVTTNYEYWQTECNSNKNKILFSIALPMLILIFIMLLHQYINFCFFAIPTVACCIVFIYNLISLNNLMKLSNDIFGFNGQEEDSTSITYKLKDGGKQIFNEMYNNFLKRSFDLIVSIIGLIVLSPIFLFVMIALAIANNGKPFFFQKRPGKNEKIFNIIKFKTMNDKKDVQGNLLSDAERLTPIGAFVRKTSLDEIPQLINVLKGDMSMIGPRPLLIQYLPLYNAQQKRRHEVKPGITGWAQVNGRNAISWQQKFEYDVWYVDNISMLLDLKIGLMTIQKIFKSEGISSDTSVTMEAFKGNEIDNK